MQIVDLSHVMNIHSPAWVGFAGNNKLYYTQNLQTGRIVTQRIDTALHVGTHMDGAMHATDGYGDMASYPMEYWVNKGIVVDLSPWCEDWTVITPRMIQQSGAKVEKGDIVILHTGYHRYYEGKKQQDLVRYFCMHPGGSHELLEWMLDMKIKWFGTDGGSGDHPMNTSIRERRLDLRRQFENKVGKSCEAFFGEYSYIHKRSGRKVVSDILPFHSRGFQEGLIHAENIGGDIERVLNCRCIIGAFPWKFQGLEACPCRILCFFDCGEMEVRAFAGTGNGKPKHSRK